MDKRHKIVKEWFATLDFISFHGISIDEDGDPNFALVAKSNVECIRMSNTYHKRKKLYLKYTKSLFTGGNV